MAVCLLEHYGCVSQTCAAEAVTAVSTASVPAAQLAPSKVTTINANSGPQRLAGTGWRFCEWCT
jgi:hypothetical protein